MSTLLFTNKKAKQTQINFRPKSPCYNLVTVIFYQYTIKSCHAPPFLQSCLARKNPPLPCLALPRFSCAPQKSALHPVPLPLETQITMPILADPNGDEVHFSAIRSLNNNRKTGRLPTIATNCSVLSLTDHQIYSLPRRFVLQAIIRDPLGQQLGNVSYFELMDGRHCVLLSTCSTTIFERYHNMAFTWGNIFFQTALGRSGAVVLEIPPVDLVQLGLPQATRNGYRVTKFDFIYYSADNTCDERLVNGARALGANISDNSQATECCLIL